MASDAKNKFPIRRKLRSVYMAKHTKIFPAIDRNIISDRSTPGMKERKRARIKSMGAFMMRCEMDRCYGLQGHTQTGMRNIEIVSFCMAHPYYIRLKVLCLVK